MIDPSVSLKIARGQISAIEKRITNQMQAYQQLLILSCDMFKRLYELKPDEKLLKRWYEIVQQIAL